MRNRQKKIQETLEKARPEYDSGNYWRAKEIIRSGVGTYGYDVELYSFYASILLAMHDKMQAGKYCFLSKEKPTEEEQEAIDLFIERHKKYGYRGILKSIPGKSCFSKLSDYPKFVQERFISLGATEHLGSIPGAFKEKVKNSWGFIGCLIPLLLIIICFIVGFITIIKTIFS
jgi:hypothetical protein